jgi:8-oxo-dGTP pyrophosphatase MutT (NUDIX family)
VLQFDATREAAPTKDAATIIVLRDLGAQGFEVLFVKRAAGSQFMGGAYVFPGGKLDAADSAPSLIAAARGRTASDAAAALNESEDAAKSVALYIAAIRETFEEAGILFADLPIAADRDSLRMRLASGAPFAALMEEAGAALRLDALVPHARWVTPAAEPRRFDARFFLARAPADQRAQHDDHEATDSVWLTPQDALARAAKHEIQLPPPTLRTLELLSEFVSADEALKVSANRKPPYVWPVFKDDEGVHTLLLPGDREHPEKARALDGPTRFILRADGRWESRD